LREDIAALKKEMATNTNAVSTMMESMHDLVDGFSSLQDEISALSTHIHQAKDLVASTSGISTQQKDFVANVSATISSLSTQYNDLATSVLTSLSSLSEDYKDLTTSLSVLAKQQNDLADIVAQLSDNNNSGGKQNIDTLLQPLQALTKTVTALQAEIADLKNNQTPAPQPTTTGTNNLETLLHAQNTRIDKLFQELTSLRESTATGNTNNLETLLHAQNTRIDKLFQELTSLRKSQPQKTAPAPAPAPAPATKPQVQAQPQVQQQPQQPQRPQTLRQAMALAEQDFKQHLKTIQDLYYRGGASRAVTESTADLMTMLEDGVRVAQAGQGSG
jgi:chromosome segregation ATPase